jgi:hypothetical protein
VIDADLVAVHDLMTRISWHGVSLRGN